MPTSSPPPSLPPYEIFQHSYSMLKQLPKNSFKNIEKTMLFSKQSINFNKTSFERRTDNRNTANDITDLNINERITKFQNQLKNEFVYRISLRYFSDIGKINFLLKIDFRIKCHIETDMKKLFELKKRVTTIGGPDVKSIFTKALFIQYE